MNRDRFIQRAGNAACVARRYSWSEMMAQRDHQPYIERLAKIAFVKTACHFIPDEISIGGKPYALWRSGGEQLVYATKDRVAKVIFGSATFDGPTAEDSAAHYQSQYEIAKAHLLNRLADTEFDSRKIRSGIFAAVALQPRLQPEHVFHNVEDMVFHRSDDAYMEELQSLCDGLINLYDDSKLQMDLHGPDNIFLLPTHGQPNLVIVDTIPVGQDRQNVALEDSDLSFGEFNQAQVTQMRTVVHSRVRPDASRVAVAH